MTHRAFAPRLDRALRAVFQLVLVLAFGAPFTASAQGNGFHAVYSRDGLDVWAVGEAGACYRSFDGGASWTSFSVGTARLRGVAAQGFTVHLVGDDGVVQRSTNSGGAFTPTALPGAPDLYGVHFADAGNGWIVGEAGAIFATTDGGANWSAQASGVGVRLTAVDFLDSTTGWVVGDDGTVLATTDGGANWTPQAPGTTGDLLAVDVTLVGATEPVVWAVGARSTAVRSLDGGDTWTSIALKIDSMADVTGVRLLSATSVFLTGGGGFLRASTDGGATWTYRQHLVQGDATGLYLHTDGLKGWMCNRSNRMVLRTSNGGTSWSLPGGTTISRSFALKQAIELGVMRGSTLAQNPFDRNVLYAVLGSQLYRSGNRGDTWSDLYTIPGVYKTNAFFVSTADSLLMVAAAGTPDRIFRSVDGGATWSTVLTREFTEYGVPIEVDPNDPDRMIFGAEDGYLYESLDFGATWDTLSFPGFRSPCDLQIVPDSSKVVWVGDGVTSSGNGEMFVSTDGGASFTLAYTTTGSEVPMIAASRLAPGVGWATHWASGGVRRTSDFGGTWPQVSAVVSAWGVDVAKDDPNMMAFGVYSGAQVYLSFDQGTNYSSVNIVGANYSIFVPDRGTVLAEQGTGIYKLATTYNYTPASGQSLVVVSPNGGETWSPGETRTVTFAASRVALARIEYRSRPGEPWQTIAEQEGYDSTFEWTVPDDATTAAKIRVVDAWDSAPTDSSDAAFTIAAPRIDVLTASLDFGTQNVGSSTLLPVTLHANGTAALDIVSITTTLGDFVAGRTAFTIAAADTDTVGVTFTPGAPGGYVDTLVIVSNAPDSPHRIPLTGTGQGGPLLGALPDTLDFGLVVAEGSDCLVLTLDNDGTSPLSITNLASSDPRFAPLRTSFVIAAASSDTVSICYTPGAPGTHTGALTIASNDPTAPHELGLKGWSLPQSGAPEGAPRPAVFTLRQNRPNPFSGRTRVEFEVPESGPVRLEVFDLEGRLVARLVDGLREAGRHEVEFGPGLVTAAGDRIGDLASGVYFYRLTAGQRTRTERMLYLK
jgi:photosystem II stability/assembly factor-like uncharacterized protein